MKVSFHTKEKHRLLGDYLSICSNVHKYKSGAFYFVDLFAGDGICEYEIGNLKETWEGTPKLAARILTESKINFSCFFNEIDYECFKNLERNLAQYKADNIIITNKDANEYYKEVLTKIPTKNHSLFFIDPYKHSQLSWKTIETIANHSIEDTYFDKKRKISIEFIRKPEIIFNLMTYTMQTSYKQNPTLIDRYLGTKKWRDKVKINEEKGLPISEAFLETALEQFRLLYDEEPFPIIIKRIGTESLLYYLIFVSNHPLANTIFTEYYNKYVKRHHEELEREHIILSMRGKGQALIDDF